MASAVASAVAQWDDIHSAVSSLRDLIDACLTAWGPEEKASTTSTTKKRLAQRALAGLTRGQELIQVLGSNLHQLQQASSQRELDVIQASKSHQDLLQQLGLNTDDLHACQDKLRQAEADRLAALRETDRMRQELSAVAADNQELGSTISRLESELQSATFGANEASCHLSDLRAQVDQLAAATHIAEEAAAAAASALEAAQQEAEKEKAARQRHEDIVARLTADNLVFMAKLRAAESAAAAATAERDELVLALEEHKGPWMDEVRQGVETRVKEALTRAQLLEKQQELTAAQHAEQLEQLMQQQADLEAALGQASKEQSEARHQLAKAEAAASAARTGAEEAQVLAADAQAAADARAAELRVAQDSLRTMREECNERWMSERAARAQLAEMQSQLAELEAERDKLRGKLQARSDELMTQRAVNQQLMLKKEEVEWQLMAAIAKLNHEQQSQSGSPVSGMHSPISPHVAPPAQPQQKQVAAGGVSAGMHTCDAISSLLSGQQQQLVMCCSGDCAGQSPFSRVLQDPFPDVSPRKAPAAAGQQGPGLAQVPEQSEEQQGCDLLPASRGSGSLARPSVFCSAVAAAAAASGACSGSGDVVGARTCRPGAGFNGLCVATSLPSAFTVNSAGSVPDMFSLPSLSYGLATLPPPEMLVAAASRSLGGTGSIGPNTPWGQTLGLAGSGSLGIRTSSLGPASSGSSGEGDAAGAGLSLSPTGSLQGGYRQGVVVGATGGLMAPFSPLPRARSTSLPSGIGRGAVFPESLTASAVTDEEQLDVRHFSLPSNVLQHIQLQEQQQQQQVGIQQLLPSQQEQRPLAQHAPEQGGKKGSQEAAGVAGVPAACAGNGSAAVAGVAQVVRKAFLHPAFAQPAGSAPASSILAAKDSPVAATVESPSGNSSSGRSSPDAPPHRPQQRSTGGSVVSTPRADVSTPRTTPRDESSHQLHGILLNGTHSRPRSPAPGVSPSSSMKSVRFSFENLDQSLEPDKDHLLGQQSPRGKEELHGEWGLAGSSFGCRDQAAASSRDASAKQHSRLECGGWVAPAGSYDGQQSGTAPAAAVAAAAARFSRFSGSSRTSVGSPPDMGLCFSIKAGHVSRIEEAASQRCSSSSSQQQLRLQQQQIQHLKAAAAARAAACVVNMPLPKGPPVHPVFGAMIARSAPASAAGTPP